MATKLTGFSKLMITMLFVIIILFILWIGKIFIISLFF